MILGTLQVQFKLQMVVAQKENLLWPNYKKNKGIDCNFSNKKRRKYKKKKIANNKPLEHFPPPTYCSASWLADVVYRYFASLSLLSLQE